MDELIEKPPWNRIIFFKPETTGLREISYKAFEDNIPKYLIEKKEEIDIFEKEHKWELAKKLANPYEMIYTQEEKFPHPNICYLKPLSRSYFKMIELLSVAEFIQTIPKEWNHIRSAHIAEGPGGFIQATIDYIESNRKEIKKIYAMTLKSDNHYIPGWKKANNFLRKYEKILNITFGSDGTGDIYKFENQNHFINETERKVHIFTADGGFDFSVDYTHQEKMILDLVVCSFIIGLQVLTLNGIMIVKLFDTYSPSTKAIIHLVGRCFKEYTIYKPASSRPCNSERYFIGKRFNGASNNIIEILKMFHINFQKDLYPYIELSSEEKQFIETISNDYEKKQILCIDEAKKFALNPKLYETVYKNHFNASKLFCEKFKLPLKYKTVQELKF